MRERAISLALLLHDASIILPWPGKPKKAAGAKRKIPPCASYFRTGTAKTTRTGRRVWQMARSH